MSTQNNVNAQKLAESMNNAGCGRTYRGDDFPVRVKDNSSNCSGRFNGIIPPAECVRTMGGQNACVLQKNSDSDCVKLIWDDYYLQDCCLDQYAGGSFVESVTLGTKFFSSMSLDMLRCAPRWCSSDPAGECESVMVTGCADTDDSGTPLLLKQGHACQNWYRGAQSGTAPISRWAAIDAIISRYCSSDQGILDSQSCGCYNHNFYARGQNAGAGLQLYTSMSGGLHPVVLTDNLSGNTLNLSDYACIAPECADPNRALVPSSVWALRNGKCPSVCMQVRADMNIDIDSINAGNSIYVGNMFESCTNANIPTVITHPMNLLGPSGQAPIFLDLSSCSAWDMVTHGAVANTANLPPMVIRNVDNFPLAYSVTNLRAPAGIRFLSPPTEGTLSVGQSVEFDLAIDDVCALKTGTDTVEVTFSNTENSTTPLLTMTMPVTILQTNKPQPGPPPSFYSVPKNTMVDPLAWKLLVACAVVMFSCILFRFLKSK
jgi:hypothetical protein